MLTNAVLRGIICLQGEARKAADSTAKEAFSTGVDAPALCVKSLVVSGGQVLENSPQGARGWQGRPEAGNLVNPHHCTQY